MEDFPQELQIENRSINVEHLENQTGEITSGAYLLSITETKMSVQQIGAGALLIVNNYILSLTQGNDSKAYLLDSHSKAENGNLLSSSTAVLLKFVTLHLPEHYEKSVYYNC